jgi:CheY-like chemotaxis protein
MPKMNGFELACHIRQSSWNKSTPIIVVTGREDRKTMQQAFDVGATFFLQKPVDRQKLLLLFRTARGTMFDNRRRYIRVPLRTEVICETGTRTIKGMSWNISQGGILIEAAELRALETS